MWLVHQVIAGHARLLKPSCDSAAGPRHGSQGETRNHCRGTKAKEPRPPSFPAEARGPEAAQCSRRCRSHPWRSGRKTSGDRLGAAVDHAAGGPVGRLRGDLGGGEPGAAQPDGASMSLSMSHAHAPHGLGRPGGGCGRLGASEGLIACREQIHNASGPLPGADGPVHRRARLVSE